MRQSIKEFTVIKFNELLHGSGHQQLAVLRLSRFDSCLGIRVWLLLTLNFRCFCKTCKSDEKLVVFSIKNSELFLLANLPLNLSTSVRSDVRTSKELKSLNKSHFFIAKSSNLSLSFNFLDNSRNEISFIYRRRLEVRDERCGLSWWYLEKIPLDDQTRRSVTE